jgi:N-glycosylase/DNA lyase
VSVPVRLPNAEGLHLRRTLDSGQAFRWRWETGADGREIATGIVGRRVVRLTQDAGGLWLIAPVTPEARDVVSRYLGIAPADGARLGGVEAALAGDPVLARILPHTQGIGLLVQDPWEVLISFIVSQNNNIPKITRSIERLSRSLGEPLDGGAYAFPSPARLAAAHARTLAACLLGYRAPYVRAAARHVADGRLDLGALRRMSESGARDVLWGIPGIGEKVGDCILLFGLRHLTAFPVDVWVRRAVERFYFRNRPRTLRQIRMWAQDRFGPLAGYAQQHLFAYARAHFRKGQ